MRHHRGTRILVSEMVIVGGTGIRICALNKITIDYVVQHLILFTFLEFSNQRISSNIASFVKEPRNRHYGKYHFLKTDILPLLTLLTRPLRRRGGVCSLSLLAGPLRRRRSVRNLSLPTGAGIVVCTSIWIGIIVTSILVAVMIRVRVLSI